MTIGANVPCAHGSIPFPAWNKEAYPPWLVKKRWMCGWVSAGEKFWVRRKEEKEGGEGKEFSNTALLTSLYVRGEKTFLNMVQKTVFSYPHWPSSIRPTFLKANFTTEGKGDFRASVAREKKSKKKKKGCVDTKGQHFCRLHPSAPASFSDGGRGWKDKSLGNSPGREREHTVVLNTPPL